MTTSISAVLEQQQKSSRWVSSPAWLQYLETGDEALLGDLPTFPSYSSLPDDILAALPSPDRMDEESTRFFRACIVAGHPSVMGEWLTQRGAPNDATSDLFDRACELPLSLGCPKHILAGQVLRHSKIFEDGDGRATGPGRFLLALDEGQLTALVLKYASSMWQHDRMYRGNTGPKLGFTRLMATHAPARWAQVLDAIIRDTSWQFLSADLWVSSLDASPVACLEACARAFEHHPDAEHQFDIGTKLAEIDPVRFGETVYRLAVALVDAVVPEAPLHVWFHAGKGTRWLVLNHGVAALPVVSKFIAASCGRSYWRDKRMRAAKAPVLDIAIETLGRDAIPLLDAAFAKEQPLVQLRAFEHWLAIRQPADTERIATAFRFLLKAPDASTVARAVRIAGDLKMDALEEQLWAQLAHKSRQVRDAAAGAVAKLGESRLFRTEELWSARRADSRLAAVTWLEALATPAAMSALEARLDEEESDDVRDAILIALEASAGGSRGIDDAGRRARMKKTLAKIDGPPVAWLNVKKLPAAKLVTGAKLSADTLLYLLYRQSRVKEMRADIEARPTFALIDRTTSGNLGLAVAQAYFKSDVDADDRWAMAFAALVGDDRLVPLFTRQIRDWADGTRGKLAEYAVQALALLGTDAALIAVDAMSIRYRSKNKNIGKAASDAFTSAAEARGLTVEELGDLVVPWLGFLPGEMRVVETAKASVEIRIGSDFKLAFRDVATGKSFAKLPSGASAEVQADLKEVAAALKEAVKSQLLRMETLVVRQFRWPVARWKELYLQHPLLLPFAQRLVWGTFDDARKLTRTFRVLDDRTLTDEHDESLELSADGTIGIVHPLELADDVRRRWITHFADYVVMPPFPQLERPVVLPSDEQRTTTFGRDVNDTKLNAMTFKGRAERLGWSRGSVCDSGYVGYYYKTFPGAGVDCFVETDEMYVGIDMYSDITLGRTFFVRHGSVRIGSYVYDEPKDADDERLVVYGDIPGIVFSESMGDLAKIAGRAIAEAVEA